MAAGFQSARVANVRVLSAPGGVAHWGTLAVPSTQPLLVPHLANVDAAPAPKDVDVLTHRGGGMCNAQARRGARGLQVAGGLCRGGKLAAGFHAGF